MLHLPRRLALLPFLRLATQNLVSPLPLARRERFTRLSRYCVSLFGACVALLRKAGDEKSRKGISSLTSVCGFWRRHVKHARRVQQPSVIEPWRRSSFPFANLKTALSVDLVISVLFGKVISRGRGCRQQHCLKLETSPREQRVDCTGKVGFS